MITSRPWASDLAVAAAVAVVVVVPTVLGWPPGGGVATGDGIAYGLIAVSLAALVVRRRAPLAVSIVTGVAFTVLHVRTDARDLFTAPTMVALYTVAAQGTRARTITAGVVACAWAVAITVLGDSPGGRPGDYPVFDMVLWPVVALAAGELRRSRQELAEHAARERELAARRQIEAARSLIASDFHDVVAHTMTAVHVQLAAALTVFDSDPASARGALVEAKRSSKAAQQELHASVATLRGDAAVAPTPGLSGLQDLVQPARAAGLAVDLEVDANHATIPSGVAVTAYRVVQEALTNTVKHSDARHVDVSVRHRRDELHVEVTDDGTASCRPAPQAGNGTEAASSGLGLRGMNERVSAIGGSVTHGPTAEGGFRVRAILPMAPEPT